MINFSRKDLRVAILVGIVVLFGAATTEAATIFCGVDDAGCNGVVGSYSPGQGLQSNTWEFYDGLSMGQPVGILRYTFTIAGTPTSNFALDVTDTWDWPFYQVAYQGQTLDCVVNDSGDINGSCTMFAVSLVPGSATPAWVGGGYDVSILWRTLGQTPPPSNITILRDSNDPNFLFLNAVALLDTRYAPNLAPPDPGIGGRGDSFSSFGVFTGPSLPEARLVTTKADLLVTVPEPTSLILLGAGLGGLAVRMRRRSK